MLTMAAANVRWYVTGVITSCFTKVLIFLPYFSERFLQTKPSNNGSNLIGFWGVIPQDHNTDYDRCHIEELRKFRPPGLLYKL